MAQRRVAPSHEAAESAPSASGIRQDAQSADPSLAFPSTTLSSSYSSSSSSSSSPSSAPSPLLPHSAQAVLRGGGSDDNSLNNNNSSSSPRTSSPARITRSAARRAQQASSGPSSAPLPPPTPPLSQQPLQHQSATPIAPTTAPQSNRRKRKAPEAATSRSSGPSPTTQTSNSASARRSKKQKTIQNVIRPATAGGTRRRRRGGGNSMSAEGQDTDPVGGIEAAAASGTTSRRKSARNRKSDASNDTSSAPRSSGRRKKADAKPDEEMPDVPDTPTADPSRRRNRRKAENREEPTEDEDVDVNDVDFDDEEEDDDDEDGDDSEAMDEDEDQEQDQNEDQEDEDEMDEDGQLRSSFLSRFGSGGFAAGRLFGGLMSGSATTSRLREMLDGLKSEDPSLQMIALQDLSSFLLISTEDNLAGHFSPDSFVRELVKLMQPNEITGEVNEEMELMACRCIANLMEALPQSAASVVYGGAIPVICGKLLMINSIEVAEQSLTTLEKISVDFPGHIVKEGGLSACLGFLDFFPTGTQRSAVTTVANSCRNIPDECFQTVRDVMPILENTLNNADQKVVEQAALSVSRISESFRSKPEKLEQLVSENLLRSILRLLMPGSTNLIPADIHTKFLRVLAFTARASPSHSAALVNMDVVDTLYQILTGVSPPDQIEDVASHIDGVVIMQALIRKQREQIYETLNVICELLPGLANNTYYIQETASRDMPYMSVEKTARDDLLPKPQDCSRRELLNSHKEKLRRFAAILLPTLTHAYTSTVNLAVRQKVLTAQLKMLSNFDVDVLESSLKTVPLASHLASILSQQDHPVLVLLGLQAARLLFDRLGHIYAYQFCREGVLTEIEKLADRPLQADGKSERSPSNAPSIESPVEPTAPTSAAPNAGDNEDDGLDQAEDNREGRGSDDDVDNDDEGEDADNNDEDQVQSRMVDDDDEDEDDDDEDDDDDDDEGSPSPSDSTGGSDSVERDASPPAKLEDVITKEAKKFIEVFEKMRNGKIKIEANAVLESVRAIATDIQQCYAGDDFRSGNSHFQKLAKYFGGDALQSITSAELLRSDLVDVFLDIFASGDESAAASKLAFLQVFNDDKAQGVYGVSGIAGTSSPFSALVQKLQDLLSRSEHFEVITVHNNGYDSNRSGAAAMLAKQLRLKLVAEEDSEVPRAYRNIMVSIHAIATFKALDDYLRPRLSLGDRPRGMPRGSEMLATLANAPGIPPEARQRILESGFLGSLAGMPPPLPSLPSSSNNNSPGTPSDTRRQSRRKSSRQGSMSDNRATAGNPTPPAHSDGAAPSLRRTPRPTRAKQGASSSEPSAAEVAAPLECADERQLTDEDEEDDRALLRSALADVARNEQSRDETPDPDAVNMEVASTGKVTARQEDGTRIPTPSQTATSTTPPPPPPPPPPHHQAGTPSQSRTARAGPSSSSNPSGMSYAAAIRATPQDWHIEFSINGQVINNETTIYRAVHYRPNQPDEPASRSLWSSVHPIAFKRVPGPPAEATTLSPPPESGSEPVAGAMPASLHKNPLTSKILRLLNILHGMNEDLDSVMDDQKSNFSARSEPASLFVNTKLTAKLNRQLEEPLIVASNCLPGWSEDLARLYPFLFPFETRHLFLQSTSFGYSRSMTRWQSAQNETSRRSRHRDERPFLGRLQRQKVRISRSRILESAMKVMELYGASPSMLEVEYFEEVGTGLGPTLEFYSTVSKEFSKKKIKLWRENESAPGDDFAFGKHGLFPAPLGEDQATSENGRRILHLFKMMGKFIARSMLDSRIVDISFNPIFFRFSESEEGEEEEMGNSSAGINGSGNISTSAARLGLAAIKQVDNDLYKSLKMIRQFVTQKRRIDEDPRLSETQKATKLERIEVQGANIADLGLDFTLPGYPSIELCEHGGELPVDINNVEQYLDLVVEMTLGKGVRRQIGAFRQGFSQVFPYSALRAFTPAELVMLFGRNEEDWSIETLTDSIKADHGYNMDSKSVRNLLDCMSNLDEDQKRNFLQFVTGSPKLPIGGFKALVPLFTVVCKPAEKPYTSDDYLPSVMTCANYLKLPDYTDINVMRGRLFTAIKEGQGAFLLS